MTTFQSVNMSLPSREHTTETTTPTTPRAFLHSPITSIPPPLPPPPAPAKDESGPTTPTRHSFGASAKRALPTSPFNKPFPAPQQPASQTHQDHLTRADSHRSVHSTGSQDVDMDDSDEGEEGSDAESMDDETGRPLKKKKGQRFYCTDFPPCNLSFTRSEHLARHIRYVVVHILSSKICLIFPPSKHTGERPFQCHCARRFSRLDNLRQHAQTVHVNEEIPGDSLAATSARFQRQIRTDRVRPSGARSRASTTSSQGGAHARGHGRNLSTSSVGSTTSTLSRDDSGRRPPPLIMAHDPTVRARLTLDTLRGQMSTPPGSYTYANQSSAGPSTPMSTTYSNGPGSPYGSSLGSPISTVSRHVGLWGGSTPGRRLSVPSGANPFQAPHGQIQAPPYLSPLMSSNASNHSSNSSAFASPTSSTYSFSRPDHAAADADWRRRTWHPSTYSNYQRPAPSGLSYYSTPDTSGPAFAPQAVAAPVQSQQRLPGIETFDQMSNVPQTPPQQGPSPMLHETPSRPSIFASSSEMTVPGPDDRRGHLSWDMSLHQNLTKLEIASGTPPKDPGLWGRQVIADMQNAASNSAYGPPPPQVMQQPAQPVPSVSFQKRSAESEHYPHPVTPNRSRRHGWYNGPLLFSQKVVKAQRTSPEDSSSSEGIPTPSAVSAEYHPSIVHANGYIEAIQTGSGASANFTVCTPMKQRVDAD